MIFNHKEINLPFHPGDPLFWVDVEKDYEIKELRNGIYAVVIGINDIKVWPYVGSDPVIPNSSDGYFITREDAEKWIKANKPQTLPVEIEGEPGKWYDPRKHIPKKGPGEIVLYYEMEGTVSKRTVEIPENPRKDLDSPWIKAWMPIGDVPFLG